jgi:hypothetical protein
MRSLVALLVLALSCLTGAASARAQSCHEPVRPGDAGWTAGARLGLGAADNEHDAGQWQSLTLEGAPVAGRSGYNSRCCTSTAAATARLA